MVAAHTTDADTTRYVLDAAPEASPWHTRTDPGRRTPLIRQEREGNSKRKGDNYRPSRSGLFSPAKCSRTFCSMAAPARMCSW